MTTTGQTRLAGVRLWGLLLVLSGNMLIDAIEVSVALVALPPIRAQLGFTVASAHWVISCFALGFGVLVLPGRRLVNRFGNRRVYLIALVVFAAASLLGAVAAAPLLLILSRLVKGCCVALTAPTGLSIIGDTFPEGSLRNRAVAIYSLFGASGFTAGLLLSGLLTGLSWRLTFLFPAPVAFVLFMAGLALIPRDEPAPPGARAAANPFAPLHTLRHAPLVRSMFGAAVLNGTNWGFLYVVTFQLQDVAGWSPLHAGLAMVVPASLLLAFAAPMSGGLVGKFGAAPLVAIGALGPPIGYALYLRAGADPVYTTEVMPSMAFVGIGFALGFAALQVQAVNGVPADERAVATGLYQTAVQVGGAVVLAIVATVLSTGVHDRQVALAVLTGIGALGFFVALPGLFPRSSLRRRK